MKRIFILLAALGITSLGFSAVAADATDPKLAQQGYDLMKKYCYRCHGVEFNGSQSYNVLDRDGLIAKRGTEAKPKKPYVTPGKPEDSVVWKKIESKEMPPEDEREQPSDPERAIIRQWIEAGAGFPARSERPFKADIDVLSDIRDHLRKVPQDDRPFQRYFTLTHLYNNNKAVTDFDLRLYRAGMSKLANSLSWQPDIVVPTPVDKEETIYNVDLRTLGWDRPIDEHTKENLWQEILKFYPYGLIYESCPDPKMRDLWREVYDLSGSKLPYIRADWFIATASRPPLYHTLLRIPKTAKELEAMLKVDFENNFLHNNLVRAGFATSGVSKQNRLVERHSAAYGSYWKSYDFRPGNKVGDLTQFPLGPVFDNNPFPHQAFNQAGGELIWNLPNGLQAYMLIKTDGGRIDEGPIDIVNDTLKTAGSPAIVTGLSCMACHRQGMLGDFKDAIRAGSGVGGDALLKVEQLFPPDEVMKKLVAKDTGRFERSLDEAIAPFLKVGEDKGKEIAAFPEPVGAVARLYVKDLDVTEAAVELGIDKPERLQGAIEGNRTLRGLGLGPLMQAGGAINREHWDSKLKFLSTFQNAARELDRGTPFVPF